MRLSPSEVRRLLDAERERTLARLELLNVEHRGFVEASRDSNADDEHDPEGTTIAFERSQVGSLIEQARARLHEIASACGRLEAETYGVCEVCGSSIAAARLEVRPTATRCLKHA